MRREENTVGKEENSFQRLTEREREYGREKWSEAQIFPQGNSYSPF
jgi:hypothetical protein